MVRRAVFGVAILLLIAAIVLAVSGGGHIAVGGLRVSARSPSLALVVGTVALAVWAVLAARRGAVSSDGEWLGLACHARSRAAMAIVAALSAGVAMRYGTYSPSGADASGYLSQARLWAAAAPSAAPMFLDDLANEPGWPLAANGTVPLGWRPALEPGKQVPTYAPGLPLLMAAPFAAGGSFAASTVVTVSSALAVWATGSLASGLAGPLAGVMAALLLATSPVFLLQSLQPMSDVPATAAWAFCWAILFNGAGRAREGRLSEVCWLVPLASGVAAAIAVLIRPNLAPLAIVPLAVVMRRARKTGRSAIVRHSSAFSLPVAIAGVSLAWLQWQWYGSPLASGYDATHDLFAFANLAPNGWRYLGWIWQTQPILLLTPLSCLMLGGLGVRGVFALPVFAVSVVGAYLVYAVFDDWSYLRFMLPAVAVALVTIGVAASRVIAALPRRWHGVAALGLGLAFAAHGIGTSRSLAVFALADAHARAWLAGRYLGSATSPGAVIVAGEQSGAMRLLTDRPIVRWEVLSEAQLRSALASLEADGRDVWWVLDEWEGPLVRARFPDVAAAALDWPPRLDAGPTQRTRAWRVADRADFLAGKRLVTDRLRE